METLLDQRRVSELRRLAGGESPGLLERLSTILRRSGLEVVESLARAIEARDSDMAEVLAHRLKGSSLTVGALPLATLCGSIEQRAREGRIDDDCRKRYARSTLAPSRHSRPKSAVRDSESPCGRFAVPGAWRAPRFENGNVVLPISREQRR